MSMTERIQETQHAPLTSWVFNIYCDESCHLENDGHSVMVLGAVWCSLEETRNVAVRIREIKQKHGLKPDFEVKWTKVSPARERFYLDLIDECQSVDVRYLHRNELLKPGGWFTLRWSRAGRENGSIRGIVDREQDGITLVERFVRHF